MFNWYFYHISTGLGLGKDAHWLLLLSEINNEGAILNYNAMPICGGVVGDHNGEFILAYPWNVFILFFELNLNHFS